MTRGAPEGRRMRTWVPGRMRSPVGVAIVVVVRGGGGEEVGEGVGGREEGVGGGRRGFRISL